MEPMENQIATNRKFRYRKDWDFENLYKVEEWIKYKYWPGGHWKYVKLASGPEEKITEWIQKFVIENEWKYYP